MIARAIRSESPDAGWFVTVRGLAETGANHPWAATLARCWGVVDFARIGAATQSARVIDLDPVAALPWRE